MKLYKKQIVRWTLDGRRVKPRTPGATSAVHESRRWYGTVNGKPVPLSTDATIARKKLRKLLGEEDLRSIGLTDPFGKHTDTALADHLTSYRAALEAKGSTAEHVAQTAGRIEAALSGCGFEKLTDFNAESLSVWLTQIRQARPMMELPGKLEQFTPEQAAAVLGISGAGLRAAVKRHALLATGKGRARRLPRRTVEFLAERSAQGASLETVNHYIRALRSFGRWLVRSKRTAANPFEPLALLNSQVDVRHARRELTAEELTRLFDMTRNSTRTFRGLTGEDRFHLYLCAAATGFRARALSNLTPADFDFRFETPIVTLAARFNKSKKAKVQPLPPEAAENLEPYLHDRPRHQPVWGGTWARDHRGAEMLRGDLDAAGIPYVVDGTHGPEHADFHALRHSYLTLLGRSGVDLRTAQVLAGHSRPELTARYTHRRLDDLAGAVARLPRLLPAAPKPARRGCSMVARNTDRNVPFLSSPGLEPGMELVPAETKNPLEMQGIVEILEQMIQRGRRGSNPQPPDRQSPDDNAQDVIRLKDRLIPKSWLLNGCQELARHVDPELARLLKAWSTLPAALRVAVLAIVDSAKPQTRKAA